MGLGKLIIMGLLGVSAALEIGYAGYYLAGGKSERKGASAVVASIGSAFVNGLCFLALYLEW